MINDFSIEVAIIGNMPNNLGTIPASLGYMSLIVLWNKGSDSGLKRRLRAAGRMALTNYLTQTIVGVLVLTVLLADVTVNRSGILLFVLAVWTVQLWWSQAWLDHFRFRSGRVAMAGWDLPAIPALAPGAGNLTTHLREARRGRVTW